MVTRLLEGLSLLMACWGALCGAVSVSWRGVHL